MTQDDYYRPQLPKEAKEQVEKLKEYYRGREKDKKEMAEELDQEFDLGTMPWRHENNLQFKQGYIITQALKHNTLVQDD